MISGGRSRAATPDSRKLLLFGEDFCLHPFQISSVFPALGLRRCPHRWWVARMCKSQPVDVHRDTIGPCPTGCRAHGEHAAIGVPNDRWRSQLTFRAHLFQREKVAFEAVRTGHGRPPMAR